jgi:hypothetical protein
LLKSPAAGENQPNLEVASISYNSGRESFAAYNIEGYHRFRADVWRPRRARYEAVAHWPGGNGHRLLGFRASIGRRYSA